jgi:hypothetical protein
MLIISLCQKNSAEQVKVAMDEDLPAAGSLLANSHANQYGIINKQSTVWHSQFRSPSYIYILLTSFLIVACIFQKTTVGNYILKILIFIIYN